MAAILILTSAFICLCLGTAHIYLTLFTSAFDPRDEAVKHLLNNTNPRLTNETTFANAAIGFHISHSLGIIIFALIFGYLAAIKSTLLFDSNFLLSLGLISLIAYLLLAIKYWFSKPLIGIAAALIAYIGGIIADVI